MAKQWIQFNNFFLTATAGSYRLTRLIGRYTQTSLATKAGDAFFDGLINLFATPFNNFTNSYDMWISLIGDQISKSKLLNNLLDNLSSTLVEDWEVAVKPVFRIDTPGYIRLFPNGRKPFYTGSQEDRIAAVKALIENLGATPELQTLKNSITTFYTQLVDALTNQKKAIENTKLQSNLIETNRIALCVVLYRIKSKLCDFYAETPEMAASFFDEENLRDKQQSQFSRNLKKAETKLIVVHTFQAGDKVRIINEKKSIIRAFLGKSDNDTIGNTFVELKENDDIIYDIETLGPIDTNRYLFIQNTDANLVGRFKLILM